MGMILLMQESYFERIQKKKTPKLIMFIFCQKQVREGGWITLYPPICSAVAEAAFLQISAL